MDTQIEIGDLILCKDKKDYPGIDALLGLKPYKVRCFIVIDTSETNIFLNPTESLDTIRSISKEELSSWLEKETVTHYKSVDKR